jgi:hypothetical protein
VYGAGQFIGENTGFTHIVQNSSGVTFSAYRFHETDPFVFSGGMQFVWRNGDTTDPSTGMRTMMLPTLHLRQYNKKNIMQD